MTQEIQEKKKGPVILQYLDQYKDQLAAALPKHLTADRMARIVTTEIRKTPDLLACNPKSLFGAVIQCSQLGLEPGNALGHAYLLPFNKRVKDKQTGRESWVKDVNLIIGYRGMIALARNSGQIKSIEARSVYDGDDFTYEFGLEPDLKHRPGAFATRGNLTHVYAVAKLNDGGVQWDVMSLEEVQAVMEQSKAKNFGPWKTHFEEMAKKTVIRRLFKYLPVSIEMQNAVGMDEQADAGVSQKNDSLIDGEFMVIDEETGEIEDPPEPETKTDQIKDKLKNS